MPVRLIDLLPAGHEEEVREEESRHGGRAVVSLRLKRGWQSIDSPYDPEGEAGSILGDEISSGDSLIILGAGSGFVASALAERGVRDAVLITGSRLTAEKTRARLSISPEDGCRIVVVAADDAERVWRGLLREFAELNPGAVRRVHPREAAAFPALIGGLEIRLAGLENPGRRPSRNPPETVLFAGSGGLLEREMKAEFSRRGIEVAEVPPFAGGRTAAEEVWRVLDRYTPDLVISTNNLGSNKERFLIQRFSGHILVRVDTW